MGLKSIRAVPKNERKELLNIDLSMFTGEEGDGIKFREPSAADLFPDTAELKKLRIRFPEFPEAMVYQVALMGRCYVPEPGDSQVDESPMDAIGNLARANRSVYFHIAGAFMEAFPNDDLAPRISEAKNEFAE